MRYWTDEECERWPASQRPSNARDASIAFPKTDSRKLWVARWIAANLTYHNPSLLWVTNAFVWDSNWHLYYRLRQSYGDQRLLVEAPGHYFVDHETADLSTFIQLVMTNGWDAYLFGQVGHATLFFSHDGFTDVYCDDAELRKQICENIGDTRP